MIQSKCKISSNALTVDESHPPSDFSLFFIVGVCLVVYLSAPSRRAFPQQALAPDLFSSVFSIIFEKWGADWLIFQGIPLARVRESRWETKLDTGRSGRHWGRQEDEGGILLILNPNFRIHAGSRSTHENIRIPQTHTSYMWNVHLQCAHKGMHTITYSKQ